MSARSRELRRRRQRTRKSCACWSPPSSLHSTGLIHTQPTICTTRWSMPSALPRRDWAKPEWEEANSTYLSASSISSVDVAGSRRTIHRVPRASAARRLALDLAGPSPQHRLVSTAAVGSSLRPPRSAVQRHPGFFARVIVSGPTHRRCRGSGRVERDVSDPGNTDGGSETGRADRLAGKGGAKAHPSSADAQTYACNASTDGIRRHPAARDAPADSLRRACGPCRRANGPHSNPMPHRPRQTLLGCSLVARSARPRPSLFRRSHTCGRVSRRGPVTRAGLP